MTRPRVVAVVGGGPRGTYALDRLAAAVDQLTATAPLHVHVYERTGEFGGGRVHSRTQSPTSLLNRTASQVSMCAAPTCTQAGPVRADAADWRLDTWAGRRGLTTADLRLPAGDWLPRRLHGEALAEAFAAFADDLRAHPRAELTLHPTDVVDLVPLPDGRLGVVDGSGAAPVAADHVLLVTGHPQADPERVRQWVATAAAARAGGAGYVPDPYPLADRLRAAAVPAGCDVLVRGTGLAAIDVVLELTAGRGGRFVPDGPRFRYEPSGAEPASVTLVSGSGVLPFARPADLDRTSPHVAAGRGRFLHVDAVTALRVHHGAGERGALDFDAHVLPVVVLEMAHQYYATAYGPQAGAWISAAAADGTALAALLEPRAVAVRDALAAAPGATGAGTATPTGAGTATPTGAGTATATLIGALIDTGTEGDPRDAVPAPVAAAARAHWHQLLAHAPDAVPLDQRGRLARFDWAWLCRPFPHAAAAADRDAAVADLLDRDATWAQHGVGRSPVKAATNGVWRDLRHVICAAVDDGGLTPASAARFAATHGRHHHRYANGAAPQVMRFLAALLRAGVLHADLGPDARLDPPTDGVWTATAADGVRRSAGVLVEGWIPGFDPDTDSGGLYRALRARGLVTVDGGGSRGLVVDDHQHPVAACGRPDPRITVLGPPLEGRRAFQISALRPGDHDVAAHLGLWLDELLTASRPAVVTLPRPAMEGEPTHAH